MMADAAYYILTSDSSKVTGNLFVDDEVLAYRGIYDLKKYQINPAISILEMTPDLYIWNINLFNLYIYTYLINTENQIIV